MLDGLEKGSSLFLIGDNDMLSTVKNDDYNIVFFGIDNKKCDILSEEIKEICLSTEFVAVKGDIRQKITIPTVGIQMYMMLYLLLLWVLNTEFHLKISQKVL